MKQLKLESILDLMPEVCETVNEAETIFRFEIWLKNIELQWTNRNIHRS